MTQQRKLQRGRRRNNFKLIILVFFNILVCFKKQYQRTQEKEKRKDPDGKDMHYCTNQLKKKKEKKNKENEKLAGLSKKYQSISLLYGLWIINATDFDFGYQMELILSLIYSHLKFLPSLKLKILKDERLNLRSHESKFRSNLQAKLTFVL